MRNPETIEFWVGRLPHWQVADRRHFITIHLAGAIPVAGQRQIRVVASQLQAVTCRESPQWLKIQRQIFAEMERWLDRVAGVMYLRRSDVASIVTDAIEHRHGRGDWHVIEYVVMPNHIHLLCEFGAGGMKATLEDFKRWTGHRAAQVIGGIARFWQREWFDHWSRSEDEDERILHYIRQNPVKAGLVKLAEDWPYAGPTCQGGTWSKD